MSLVVSHEIAPSPSKPRPQQADPDQPALLVDLFGVALHHWSPRSVAELAPTATGFDTAFWYLDGPGNRYILKCSLELHHQDLTGARLDVERVKLVHAPLMVEHLNDKNLLEDAIALVAPGGAFSVVLKLPEDFEGQVSHGQPTSIHRRKAQWTLVNPVWMREVMGRHGFSLTMEVRRPLSSGRKLWLGIFSK